MTDQHRESNLIHNHEPVSSNTDLTTSPHSDSDPLLPVQPHSWSLAQKLRTSLPSTSTSSNWKKQLQCTAFYRSLDRVNVLGSSATGHTGCVNALSWARGGDLLLSGGDDTTVRLWRLDSSDTSQEYPFVCDAVIRTGHRSNIFANHMLPHSNRIASVARDKQVRVFDITDVILSPPSISSSFSGTGRETEYTARQTNVRVLKCHSAAVKRISTEDSPDVFLTVSEDGSVRQHDLRVHHNCGDGSCPEPLVHFSFSLSTLGMSPLTPWQFVVAGESAYGYLFDRRHVGRQIQQEWGVPTQSHDLTTCVRRFGRTNRSDGETPTRAHITGARMASDNGHEVLLSYSSDAVYLYSTLDSPHEGSLFHSGVLNSNSNSKQASPSRTHPSSPGSRSRPHSRMSVDQLDTMMEQDIARFLSQEDAESREDGDSGSGSQYQEEEEEGERRDEAESITEDEDDNNNDDNNNEHSEIHDGIPVILPSRRFSGICNVETVKDVNFLGPRDEFVVSGSDDGNVFIWDKLTGKLCDILQGDNHVVNVIEGHPYLPLIAVSGIDTTVKLFAPAHGPSQFSRMKDAETIISKNHDNSTRRIDLGALMMYARIARRSIAGSGITVDDECTTQ